MNLKFNKSQGFSIEVIVIAAIALGVLIISFLLLTNQSSSATKNLNSCSTKNGKCASDLIINKNDPKKSPKEYQCDNEFSVKIYVSDAECGESKLCCLKIG